MGFFLNQSGDRSNESCIGLSTFLAHFTGCNVSPRVLIGSLFTARHYYFGFDCARGAYVKFRRRSAFSRGVGGGGVALIWRGMLI